MTLKEKIDNIKKILHYCKDNEVKIIDNDCADFFFDFFEEIKPTTGYVTIALYEDRLIFEYEYVNACGDYDITNVLLEEERINEIPFDIWEKIENEAFIEAKENVKQELEKTKFAYSRSWFVKKQFDKMKLK